MKRINILFGTALLCASTAFISCSSDSDDVIQNNSEATQIAPQTITVAAPTISADGTDAKTRIAYTNGDDKISMEWASGDQIKVVTYQYESGTWNRKSGTATFDWVSGNTFTDSDASDKNPWTSNGTDRGQVISYNVGADGQVSQFESKTTSVTQTQAGNDNIDHLSTYYHAMLQYVSKYENPVFSSEWAEAAAQRCSSAPEGSAKFYQSSILMFDLNLPEDANLTQVTKLEVVASSNIFYTKNNHSDTPVNTITLNFSGITSSMSGQTLTGYFALPAADWTIPADTKLSLRVYYSASDYIEKNITINKDVTLKAGKLGKIATNSKGWSKLWTFTKSEDVYTVVTAGDAGLYYRANGESSIKFGDKANGVTWSFTDWTLNGSNLPGNVTLKANGYKGDITIATAGAGEGSYAGDNDSHTLAFTTTSAGKVYIAYRNKQGADDRNHQLFFKASDAESFEVVYSETSANISSATNRAGQVEYTATKGGIFVFKGGVETYVYAIKFVPSN